MLGVVTGRERWRDTIRDTLRRHDKPDYETLQREGTMEKEAGTTDRKIVYTGS